MKSATFRVLPACLALIFLLPGCEKAPDNVDSSKDPSENPSVDPTVEVTGVKLDKTSASVKVGESLQLTAEISPENATDKSLEWFSSDEEVATVSSSGLVLGVTEGVSLIEVKTSNGLSASCEVVVFDDEVLPLVEISSITVEPSEVEINVGESFKLTATVAPENAEDKTISWRSSSTSTVSVASDGTITGGKAGTATVTAYKITGFNGEVTGTCKVTVVQKVISIELSRSEAHLNVGNTLYLYATVTPENAPSAQNLVWESSDEGVAEVDQSGKVTALAAGTAEITASADGVSGKCTITVENVAGGNEGTGEENWK